MAEEVPRWAEEEKRSRLWIPALIIGALIAGVFVVVYTSRGGENMEGGQPPGGPKSPVASFTYSPSSPTMVSMIQFTDTSLDEDGHVVLWLWNFGDGTTSTAQNPVHRFTTAGSYIVTLTVTDDDGNTDSHNGAISVSPGEPSEMVFQDFEPSNGTPGAYFYDAWRSTSGFESGIVHSGAKSVKMVVPAPDSENTGATIGINAASSLSYMDLQNATVLSVWVYDTQGNNTIQLKLKDMGGTTGPGLWSDMSSTQNVWTKISWDISSYSGVDKSRIASIEFYEWNQGTYYFDNISLIKLS